MGFLKDLINKVNAPDMSKPHNFLENVVAGSLYKVSDIKDGSSCLSDIRSTVTTMRALAEDSQIATALSYYATDSTIPNSSGQIIWATPLKEGKKESQCAELVNSLFNRWNVNAYARDHILELATIGNLYIPTTELRRDTAKDHTAYGMYIGLDSNNIPDEDYDILPSHNLDPKEVLHLWHDYEPCGFILQPDEGSINSNSSEYYLLPESSIIHFSLGGLIGKYSIATKDADGNEDSYDVQFANPLLESAVQPTQTLNLLEDATILSSLIKIVRFISIDCKNVDEEDILPTLTSVKNMIEQQMSLNTSSGDAQSYLNPQSPNNIIYLPKVNDNSPIEITDLNLRDNAEGNDKLLEYYQGKKLSVLGIPKEALNFSSEEGLGGAGAVMSQRSSLYADALQRLETAYINGWKSAINTYFTKRNLFQYVNQFELHMSPILTEMSTIQFDKRDSALSQATQMVELLNSLKNTNDTPLKEALIEILNEALPKTASNVSELRIDLEDVDTEDEGML